MTKTNESYPCSNDGCHNVVQARRPSKSGTHWCTAPKCQSAKQRFYRERKKKAEVMSLAEATRKLLYDLVSIERTACALCGRPDALPGWFHPDVRDPLSACFGVGSHGQELRGTGFLQVVHPRHEDLEQSKTF